MKKLLMAVALVAMLVLGIGVASSQAQTYTFSCFGAIEGTIPGGTNVDLLCSQMNFVQGTAQNPYVLNKSLSKFSLIFDGSFEVAPNRSITQQAVIEVFQAGQWVLYPDQQPLAQTAFVDWSKGHRPYWTEVTTSLPVGDYRARGQISDQSGILALSGYFYFRSEEGTVTETYTLSCFGAIKGAIPAGTNLDTFCSQASFLTGVEGAPYLVNGEAITIFGDGSFNIAPNRSITQRAVLETYQDWQWIEYAAWQPNAQTVIVTWSEGNWPYYSELRPILPDGHYRVRLEVSDDAGLIAASPFFSFKVETGAVIPTYTFRCFGAFEGDYPAGANKDNFCTQGTFLVGTETNPYWVTNQQVLRFHFDGWFDIAPNKIITQKMVVEVLQADGQWIIYDGQQPQERSLLVDWPNGHLPFEGVLNVPIEAGVYRALAQVLDAAGVISTSEVIFYFNSDGGNITPVSVTFECFKVAPQSFTKGTKRKPLPSDDSWCAEFPARLAKKGTGTSEDPFIFPKNGKFLAFALQSKTFGLGELAITNQVEVSQGDVVLLSSEPVSKISGNDWLNPYRGVINSLKQQLKLAGGDINKPFAVRAIVTNNGEVVPIEPQYFSFGPLKKLTPTMDANPK